MAQTGEQISILLVEDSRPLARVYEEYLKGAGYGVRWVETGEAALAGVAESAPELVLLDLELPGMSGMEVLSSLGERGYEGGVVIITAHGSVKRAVEAMQAGAEDFLVKPFDKDRLLVTVRNTLDRRRLARLVETYREDLDRESYFGFIGASLPMQAVYRMIDSAAASKATVFITGQSGTGKELCADAIHRKSPRHGGPFVPLNCGAIPRDLVESEIFGHVKGAFTGATSDRDGAALRAHGGTLFLDEICELGLDLQTKLLRFIQTGQVQKVGGSRLHPVDLRIICATNRDPFAEVQAGRFREDLYYRLHVIPIHLPPLREREDDVIRIAQALLRQAAAEEGKKFESLDAQSRRVLTAHGWPGNVRELENVIRNVVVMHEGEAVTVDMLPPPLDRLAAAPGPAPGPARTPGRDGMPDAPPATEGKAGPRVGESAAGAAAGAADTDTAGLAPALGPEAVEPLWKVEKRAIEAAIATCGDNIPKAASALGISPSTIYRKRAAWQAETGPGAGREDRDGAGTPIT